MEFLDEVGKFISSKNYANKGIRTKDGKLAYVTSTGITKPYSTLDIAGTAGPNCPNEFVEVDQTWQNLGFPIGSLMKDGQSCGNEGKYVRTEPPTTDFDWKFYLQTYGDLRNAGFHTEHQALDHWNSYGKGEGRIPNATILPSMGAIGKVGYIDIDTNFHQVQPNYLNEYSTFKNHTNATGTDMEDCSVPPPFLKYGDTVVLMHNNKTGFLNSSSVLQFGTERSNMILRPPPGDDLNGVVIRSGDAVCISSSSSSFTNDCGWWGCKVAKINEQSQLIFGSGGQNPQQFNIISKTVERGQNIRMDHSFTFLSIPLFNKAKLNLNSSVKCNQGTGGVQDGVYRYSGSNTLNHYPTPDIASSWNSNWTDISTIDCSTYQFGEQVIKKNQADLKMGQTVRCGTAKIMVEGFQTDDQTDEDQIEGFRTEGFRFRNLGNRNFYNNLFNKAKSGSVGLGSLIWANMNRKPPPPPPPPPKVYREITVPSGDSFRYVGENMLRMYPNASVGSNWDSGWNQGGAVNCTTYKVGKPMTTASDGVGVELVESPRYIYVSNGVAMLATPIEIDLSIAVFSFKTPVYDISCRIDKLKKICNETEDCVGFVQAPSNHTWQMIKPDSSAGDYKITSSMQDVYVREANVDLIDDSCDPGPVSFIKGTVLQQYPQGAPFVKGKGNNKCKIVNAPRGKVANDVPKSQEIVDKFPNVQYNKEPTIRMKAKTEEYKDVLQRIKTSKPNITLEQQYTDMQVFDEKNKSSLIIWSVLSVAILGFVVFRMKS